jgi:hypothetical protein
MDQKFEAIPKLAPTTLLAVGGNDYRRGVRFAGMIVNGGCSLGPKVPDSRIEIERAHAVLAMRASELHATLDPLYSIGFHWIDCKSSADNHNDALVGQLR